MSIIMESSTPSGHASVLGRNLPAGVKSRESERAPRVTLRGVAYPVPAGRWEDDRTAYASRVDALRRLIVAVLGTMVGAPLDGRAVAWSSAKREFTLSPVTVGRPVDFLIVTDEDAVRECTRGSKAWAGVPTGARPFRDALARAMAGDAAYHAAGILTAGDAGTLDTLAASLGTTTDDIAECAAIAADAAADAVSGADLATDDAQGWDAVDSDTLRAMLGLVGERTNGSRRVLVKRAEAFGLTSADAPDADAGEGAPEDVVPMPDGLG